MSATVVAYLGLPNHGDSSAQRKTSTTIYEGESRVERRREVEGEGCRADSSGTRSSVNNDCSVCGQDKKNQLSDVSPILHSVMIQPFNVLFHRVKPDFGQEFASY